MSKLYDIDKKIDAIIENADPETGEIDIDALDELEMEKEKLLEDLALAIKNAESDAEAYKREEQNFKNKRIIAERTAERTKEYLQRILDGKKLKTDRVTVSYRKSESVEVKDVFLLPNIYTRTKTVEEADKNKIKEALKEGKEIVGCTLIVKNNIQVK